MTYQPDDFDKAIDAAVDDYLDNFEYDGDTPGSGHYYPAADSARITAEADRQLGLFISEATRG